MPNGLTKDDYSRVNLFSWVYDNLSPKMSYEERFAAAITMTANDSPVMRAIVSEGLDIKKLLEKVKEMYES
jgi:hypothetical protein